MRFRRYRGAEDIDSVVLLVVLVIYLLAARGLHGPVVPEQPRLAHQASGAVTR